MRANGVRRPDKRHHGVSSSELQRLASSKQWWQQNVNRTEAGAIFDVLLGIGGAVVGGI